MTSRERRRARSTGPLNTPRPRGPRRTSPSALCSSLCQIRPSTRPSLRQIRAMEAALVERLEAAVARLEAAVASSAALPAGARLEAAVASGAALPSGARLQAVVVSSATLPAGAHLEGAVDSGVALPAGSRHLNVPAAVDPVIVAYDEFVAEAVGQWPRRSKGRCSPRPSPSRETSSSRPSGSRVMNVQMHH